jgi:hypothetical protein
MTHSWFLKSGINFEKMPLFGLVELVGPEKNNIHHFEAYDRYLWFM